MITPSVINASVLFKADGEPALVEVCVQVRALSFYSCMRTHVHACNNNCLLSLLICDLSQRKSFKLEYMQLPIESLECDYSDLNITLLFEDKNRRLMTEVETLPHLNSNVIKESVTFNVKGNKMYSLHVTIEAYSYIVTTRKYYFSKCYNIL